MKQKKMMSFFLVSLFLMSGCLNFADPSVDVPDVELPDDWTDIPQRSIANPHLSQYADCEDLEASLKLSIEEEYRIQLLQAVDEEYYSGGGMWLEDDMVMADGAAESSSNSGATATPRRQEGTDFSGTNNQEQGVDEADFVKTDGYFIYFLNGKILEIFGVPTFGELTHLSSTHIEGTPQSMMLDGDRLVVISTVSSWNIPQSDALSSAMGWDDSYGSWRASSLTKFTVLDVTNRSSPEGGKELYLEGYYMTAREVNATVRTVTHAWLDIPDVKSWLDLPNGYWDLDYEDPLRREIREKVAYQTMLENRITLDTLSLEDILPKVYERANGLITTHTMNDGQCADFVAPEDGLNRGFNSIFTFDLSSENFEFQADHIVGNYPTVYASADVLILTENAWDWWWFWANDGMHEATNIHSFDISNPGDTLYTGSGRVNGTILNQFSVSEYEGVVRVATTSGQWARWWMENPEPMSSSVVTFTRSVDVDTDSQILTEVGRVDNIAPEERIWSARFDADRCYLVTFRQIDPLWVIDLSDEANPTILGELEVPGVSTYIHPLSRNHLLTIGMGPANADGTGLDWSSTRLSLFNISDPTAPAAADHLTLVPVANPNDNAWVWSYSEASYEHKAFQYWAPKGLLAIPLSTYRYHSWTDSNGGYHWNYQYISKLVLVNVSEETDNLSVYGTVDHSHLYDRGANQDWWNQYNIRRSIFMGDFVYALSSAGVTATNLTSMNESASVELAYVNPYNTYYYDDNVVVEETERSEDTSSGDGGEGSSGSSSSSGQSEPARD
tara:strand:- start:2998 stop:5355 length:2358 start_codon:yes stop_codon:yes gene_type:complete